MNWTNLLLRTAIKAYKEYQRGQAREARQAEKRRLKQARLERRISLDRELGSLSPEEFEAFVATLFERDGWHASLTVQSSDMGIDINLTRRSDGRRAVVQCKRYKGTVGQSVVRDLFGVMTHEGVDDGYVVTTGHFSSAAVSFSQGKPIQLIDGEGLLEWLNRHKELAPSSAGTDNATDKGPSATVVNPEADQPAERLQENSEPYVRPETKAFMSQLLHNFGEQRRLIDSLRQEQDRSQARVPWSYFSSPPKVAQMCQRRLTRLQAIVEESTEAVTGDFSEWTPEEKLAGSFERFSASLREIGSEYKEVSSFATLADPQRSLVRGLLDCYLAVMDDLDAFFAQGEAQIGLFLDSPNAALRKGLLVRTPGGGFRLTDLMGEFPRVVAAFERCRMLIGSVAPQWGAGCLVSVAAFLCFASGLVLLLVTRI